MFVRKNIYDNVGLLTIDRKGVLNAMNIDVLNELNQSLQEFILNDKVGVIILTGAGDKAFIAGADIKLMQKMNKKDGLEFGKLGQSVTITIEQSPKPMIAAINGFALGGGCEIALACHMRFANENANFAQPEVKLGLIPGWGGTQRLPRIVGKGNATELIVGGHMIDAKEALRIGLVNRIYTSDKLLEETINFAKLILKNGPNSIAESLKCINESTGRVLTEGLSIELDSFSNLFETNETKEGMNAFAERRKPNFRS